MTNITIFFFFLFSLIGLLIVACNVPRSTAINLMYPRLTKIFFLFLIGFAIRWFISDIFDINVFQEYTSLISLGYYGFIATLTVFWDELVINFKISSLKKIIIHLFKFIKYLFTNDIYEEKMTIGGNSPNIKNIHNNKHKLGHLNFMEQGESSEQTKGTKDNENSTQEKWEKDSTRSLSPTDNEQESPTEKPIRDTARSLRRILNLDNETRAEKAIRDPNRSLSPQERNELGYISEWEDLEMSAFSKAIYQETILRIKILEVNEFSPIDKLVNDFHYHDLYRKIKMTDPMAALYGWTKIKLSYAELLSTIRIQNGIASGEYSNWRMTHRDMLRCMMIELDEDHWANKSRYSKYYPKPNLDDPKTNLDETKTNLEETKSNLDETKPNVDETKTNLDETKPNLDNTKPNLDETKPNLDNPSVTKLIKNLLKEKKPFQQPNTNSIIISRSNNTIAISYIPDNPLNPNIPNNPLDPNSPNSSKPKDVGISGNISSEGSNQFNFNIVGSNNNITLKIDKPASPKPNTIILETSSEKPVNPSEGDSNKKKEK